MKRQKTLKDLIANQLILDHGEHSIRPLYIYIKCPIGTDIMSVRLFSYVISLCKILFAMFLIIIINNYMSLCTAPTSVIYLKYCIIQEEEKIHYVT